MGADHDFAVSAENYIKTIWSLEQRFGQVVTNRELSEALQVTRPSVSQMIKKLEAQGLVKREAAARGYQLSPAGNLQALRLLRAHRLVEMFLMESLGLKGAFLHEEAERLEHAVSERLIDEMDRYLGIPKTDFSGAPIPRLTDGPNTAIFSDERDHGSLLSHAGVGRCRVRRIHDDSARVLAFLDSYGIRVGAQLEITAISDERVNLSFNGRRLSLLLSDAACVEVG